MDSRIKECLEAEGNAPDGLYSDYDLEFLDSISRYHELSEKQDEYLGRLYRIACESDH